MSHGPGEELKLKGNELFRAERYNEAADLYTKALTVQPDNHVLYSNRSACYSKLGKYEEALGDATRCVSVAPTFARGHLRKSTALNGLGKYEEALKAAEEGYKLRGSDKICRDCVSEWIRGSCELMKDAIAQLEDVPQGSSPVSRGSVQILSHIQSEFSNQHGLSPAKMKEILQDVITELQVVLQLFGHSIGTCAKAWLVALAEALKADPQTRVASATATKCLASKTEEFASYLNLEIDHALYPVVCPIFSLAILSILTCVSMLSQNISFRSVIQLLVRSCLPFFEKSVLSGKQYNRLHIHALQLLLNSFFMESGQAKQRKNEEKEEIAILSQNLDRLLKQYPSTADDYLSVKNATMEILEIASTLLAPTGASYENLKRLSASDAETLIVHVAKEIKELELIEASKPLNFRDMDSLILATGGLLHLGETKKAREALQLCESLYFRVITKLFEIKMLSLDAEAVFHPQTMMQANALFFAGSDDLLLADIFVRWKCISSESHALFVRLGMGSKLLDTFQKLEKVKLVGQGKSSHSDLLKDIGEQHQEEVGKLLQKWGGEIVSALSAVSCQKIQNLLHPDQVVMEYCMAPFYDTKCHPVPIPPKFLTMSGALIVITAVGPPLVKVIEFGKIQEIAVKMHDLAMKAVAAKRAGKPWEHLQATADEVASTLLQAMIPSDIQKFLSTPPAKQVFFCPDQILAKFPVEILPFGDGMVFGEKCALTYLSSAKELLRDSIVSSICPSLELSDQGNLDCIFFANPNFDLRCQEYQDSYQPWSQLSSVLASLFSKPVTTTVPFLPHSETEVNEAEYLLSIAHNGTLHTHVYMKDKATLYQALEVQNPFILHFATHGFSFPEFQYQYRSFWTDTKSGLLLAGANTYHSGHYQEIASEAGTGELTALAACSMALQGTRLVYLSTCRSSYGYIGRGEALSSLSQSFRTAGAQTVLATLWPVSDEVARKMATHFYYFASNPGVRPSTALQSAKRKIKEDGYDHWYDWAAFLCIGIDIPLFP